MLIVWRNMDRSIQYPFLPKQSGFSSTKYSWRSLEDGTLEKSPEKEKWAQISPLKCVDFVNCTHFWTGLLGRFLKLPNNWSEAKSICLAFMMYYPIAPIFKHSICVRAWKCPLRWLTSFLAAQSAEHRGENSLFLPSLCQLRKHHAEDHPSSSMLSTRGGICMFQRPNKT